MFSEKISIQFSNLIFLISLDGGTFEKLHLQGITLYFRA